MAVPISDVNPFEGKVDTNLVGLVALAASAHPYNNCLFPLYLLGPFWVLPLLRWRLLPPCLRACAVAAPLFLGVVLFRGDFNEPRQFMLLFTVLVPSGPIALFGRPQDAGPAVT